MDPGRAATIERILELVERSLRAYLSPSRDDGRVDLPGREVEELLERARDERWDLDQLEKRYILTVLEETGGNRTRAAEILGIDRRTGYRKLKQYESGEMA